MKKLIRGKLRSSRKAKVLLLSGKVFLVLLELLLLNIGYFIAITPPPAHAAGSTEIRTAEFFIYQYASATDIASGNGINASAYSDANDVSFTVNIPETMTDCLTGTAGTNVCHAYVEWRTVTGSQSVTSGQMKFDQCDGACVRSSTTQAIGAGVASSGESYPLVYRMDVTPELIAGSHTYKFNAQLTGTSLVRNADNAKLVVTYEYDNSSATQLRTRRFFATCGTGTTTPQSGTVNPNIAESGATVQSAWVEMVGGFPGGSNTTDGSVAISINSNAGSAINTDATNRTSYELLAMRDVTSTVNLNANNTIALSDTTQSVDNKCAELVVTYTFTPYAAAFSYQGNTVVYSMGESDVDLLGTQTTVGAARTVVVPENSKTFDSVWVRYTYAMDAACAALIPKVITSRNATGTTGSTYATTAPNQTEQASKRVLDFDITSFFGNSSNFQSGDTVTAQIQGDATGNCRSLGAELLISYHYDQSGSNLTGAKSLQWFVGQRYTAASTDFTGSFLTYLPESGESIKSAAIILDAPQGILSTTAINNIVTGGSTTCSAASTDTTTIGAKGTGENMTLRTIGVTGINSMTNTAGETVNYCLGIGSTINDTVGAYAYTTYTAPIVTLSAGSLGLTAPSSTTLSAVTLSTSTQTSTGSLGTTTIADTRGTIVGWSLTVTASNFTVSTHTNPVTNFTINPNNSTLAVTSGSLSGVTAGSSHTFTSTSDAATVASASSGNGSGTYTINPSLSLSVPVGSYAGTYTATITETLQ